MNDYMHEAEQVASMADFESSATNFARIISEYKKGLHPVFSEDQAFQMASSLGEMYWMKWFHPHVDTIMMFGTDEEGPQVQ